jgi:stage II sporulation protein D
MRSVLASILVVSMLALMPAPVATAGPDEFRFYGSGFGHGLGMSQWGAYGLSKEGWGPSRILRHFYSGTRLAAADRVPETLRIGLTQGRDKVRLEAQAGPVDLRVGTRKPAATVATIPAGETWSLRIANGTYRILDGSRNVVADGLGGEGVNLFAIFEPKGARVRVPEAGHTYARGSIEFNLYDCGPGCDLRLILVVDPEEYLYGLGEVPSSWPMGAMAAQAIAARTYALRKAAAGQHRSGCNCALYASSYDQVYAGWDKEAGTDGNRWVAAVDKTTGKVVLDGGELIQAFYMSSSGGFTENNENVWGGTPIPYLRGVCDPGDYTTVNPSATWRVSYSASELTQALGLGIGTVTGFGKVRRGVSGRITQADVKGENGTTTISGSSLRSALGLRDDRVWINRNRQIIGAIRDKYDALGCSPGLPLSKQVRVAGGQRQAFRDATIFWSDVTGAHALNGSVLAAYQDEGGPAGDLGFPLTDVMELKGGKTRARFERGVITCASDGSCTVS